MTEHLYVDLETIPDQRPDAERTARARIEAPSNYKDPEKIRAYIEGKGAEAHARTSLDGAYGEVIMIGYAFGSEEPRIIHEKNERDALSRFWEVLAEWREKNPYGVLQWVGHNVRFDLRFLWQRSLVRDVRVSVMPPYDASPWSDLVVDTGQLWSGDPRERVALATITQALGIEHDDSVTGGDVWALVRGGDLERVRGHCLEDVRVTRLVHERMLRALGSVSAS